MTGISQTIFWPSSGLGDEQEVYDDFGRYIANKDKLRTLLKLLMKTWRRYLDVIHQALNANKGEEPVSVADENLDVNEIKSRERGC